MLPPLLPIFRLGAFGRELNRPPNGALLDLAQTWFEAASREDKKASEQVAEAQKAAEGKPKAER